MSHYDDFCCISVFTLALAGNPSVIVGRVDGLWMVKFARVPSLSSSFWAWKYQTPYKNNALRFKAESVCLTKHFSTSVIRTVLFMTENVNQI